MLMSPLDHSHALNKVVTIPPRIHPTAIIAPGAQIGADVTIGPYSIIGENVIIGQGTSIASHVTIDGWTQIGERNQIGIGSIIGGIPQDLKYKGELSTVSIGDANIIREYVTINRGTEGGGGKTCIGTNNLLMTSVHVGHDVRIANNTIISNVVQIGGHVHLEDWVTIGALSGIHQFARLGAMSMIGAHSLITKDVIPYTLVAGKPAKSYGINVERLKRNSVPPATRLLIHRAYKILLQDNLTLKNALKQLEDEFPESCEIESIVRFLRQSNRGVYR